MNQESKTSLSTNVDHFHSTRGIQNRNVNKYGFFWRLLRFLVVLGRDPFSSNHNDQTKWIFIERTWIGQSQWIQTSHIHLQMAFQAIRFAGRNAKSKIYWIPICLFSFVLSILGRYKRYTENSGWPVDGSIDENDASSGEEIDCEMFVHNVHHRRYFFVIRYREQVCGHSQEQRWFNECNEY